MAFTYGFYNSSKGDRKYNAEQVSEIFDGILEDGIIPSIGQKFVVTTANNRMQIRVGTGRAWFFHTWSKNDSVMILNVPASDVSRNRYDAVVLEVNRSDNVRANSIKIVKGIPEVNATKPTLVNTDKVHQYPLAYIRVRAGSSTISASDIENMIGRSPTVFATGVLETTPLDQLWNQWEGEWDEWFNDIKLQLSGNVVTNLQLQIDQVKNSIPVKATDAETIAGNNSTKYTTPLGVRKAIEADRGNFFDSHRKLYNIEMTNVIPFKATVDSCKAVNFSTRDYYVNLEWDEAKYDDAGDYYTLKDIIFTVINKVTLLSYISRISIPYAQKQGYSDSLDEITLVEGTNIILAGLNSYGVVKFSIGQSRVTQNTLCTFSSSDYGYKCYMKYINSTYSVCCFIKDSQCHVYRISNSSNASPSEHIWILKNRPTPLFMKTIINNSSDLFYIYNDTRTTFSVDRFTVSSFATANLGSYTIPTLFYDMLDGQFFATAYDRGSDYSVVLAHIRPDDSSDSFTLIITIHGNTVARYSKTTGDFNLLNTSSNTGTQIDTIHHCVWAGVVQKDSTYNTIITRFNYITNTVTTLAMPFRGYNEYEEVSGVINRSYFKRACDGYVIVYYMIYGNHTDSDSKAIYIPYDGSTVYMVELNTTNRYPATYPLSETEFALGNSRLSIYDINTRKIIAIYPSTIAAPPPIEG